MVDGSAKGGWCQVCGNPILVDTALTFCEQCASGIDWIPEDDE